MKTTCTITCAFKNFHVKNSGSKLDGSTTIQLVLEDGKPSLKIDTSALKFDGDFVRDGDFSVSCTMDIP